MSDFSKQACPCCKAEGITEINGGICQPTPGDYCVCDRCVSLLIIGNDLQLRKADDQEVKKFTSKLTTQFDTATILSLMMAIAFTEIEDTLAKPPTTKVSSQPGSKIALAS